MYPRMLILPLRRTSVAGEVTVFSVAAFKDRHDNVVDSTRHKLEMISRSQWFASKQMYPGSLVLLLENVSYR